MTNPFAAPRSSVILFPAVLALAAVLLAVRVDLTSPMANYLWGEDGNVFMNQARALGPAGIVTPHAGYLAMYPRAIAWAADGLPLPLRPLAYAAGWVAAFAGMALALAFAGRRLGLGVVAGAGWIAATALQPHIGESLLNLTNAQWMLATGLAALVVARPNPFPLRPLLGAPLLALLGLTGPYSLILTPIIALQAWLRPRPWREWWWAGVLVACGAAQAAMAIGSGHFRTIPATSEQLPFPWNWLFPLGQTLVFGADDAATRIAALLLWASAGAALLVLRRRRAALREPLIDAALFLATAAIFLGAALAAFKANPAFIAPYHVGNRYTWVPFAMLFGAALTITARVRPLLWAGLAAAAVVCLMPFERKQPIDLQFASFAAFAEKRPVLIPLAPPRERFPNWHVDARPNAASPSGSPIVLTAADVRGVGVDVRHATGGEMHLDWNGDDPQLHVARALLCEGAQHVGVELTVQRSSAGWMQVFWSADDVHGEGRSLRRWYPDGDVTAQFAFRRAPGPLHLRIDPAAAPGAATIRSLAIYCLP
jgi:hypothetical protein